MPLTNPQMPPTEKAYYTGTHRHSFRTGQPAEILGVVWTGPENRPARACFHIRYPDGAEDFCAISDTSNYTLQGADR